ncbi:MAG: hypothetical protein ACRD1T_23580, partial [Acidimicrobiia bacterium]
MGEASEQAIQEALSALVGAPLWGSGRAVDMEMFALGQKQTAIDRNGAEISRGEYALHVQCAWHIVRRDRLVVASGDVFRPFDEDADGPGDFDWEVPGSNRRDVLLQQLFDQASPMVRAVAPEPTGQMVIALEGNLQL